MESTWLFLWKRARREERKAGVKWEGRKGERRAGKAETGGVGVGSKERNVSDRVEDVPSGEKCSTASLHNSNPSSRSDSSNWRESSWC